MGLKGRPVPEESVEFSLKKLLDALPFLEVLSPVCAKWGEDLRESLESGVCV